MKIQATPDNEIKQHRARFVTHILVLTIGWGLALFGHHCLVPSTKIPLLIALLDPAVHGGIALLLVLPFYWWRRIDLKYLLVAVFLGVIIDIDHALAAGTFRIEAMLSLPARPIGHSLLVCAIVSILAAIIIKYGWRSQKTLRFLFYLLFIALFSHIARDAIGTSLTPWNYPFKSQPFNELLYFGGFFILNFVHLYYAYSHRAKTKA